MMTCPKGHSNPDNARFCGTCGESVTPSQDSPATSDVVGPDVDTTLDDQANTTSTEPVTLAQSQDHIEADLEPQPVTDADDDATASPDTATASPDTDDAEQDFPGTVNSTPDAILTAPFVDDRQGAADVGSVTNAAAESPSNTSALAFDIAQMVSRVSSWASANEVSVAEDPYLNGLITAASRRDDLTMWASLDPMKHLPVAGKGSGSNQLWKRISSLFFVLRNVLVFVPVALTWLAISNAVDGFGDYTQRLDAGQEANFLQFWQQADPWWRIGHVAFLDFLLISAIVALTLLQSACSARAEKLARNFAAKRERERTELGFTILSALQGKRQASPESIAESLAEALNDLTQAARDVNEVAARLERASTGVESLAPQIQVLNVRVEELVATFNSGLVGSMDQFAQSVRSLDQTVAGGVSKLFEETVIGVQEINEQLARTGASIEFGTKQLRDDLDAIHAKLGTVARGGR